MNLYLNWVFTFGINFLCCHLRSLTIDIKATSIRFLFTAVKSKCVDTVTYITGEYKDKIVLLTPALSEKNILP